jgi:trimethylamine--corrinoid protein Co-methyltransferase
MSRLHGAALRILDETGVEFRSQEALDILRKGGARVDGAVARFGARTIEWALAQAPHSFPVYDRNGTQAFVYGGDEVCFQPGDGSTLALDWETGEVRPYTFSDAVEAVRLCDALPQMAKAEISGLISDVPNERIDRYDFAAWFENSAKPGHLPGDVPTLCDIVAFLERHVASVVEMAERPFFLIEDNTTSPLAYDPLACGRLIAAARWGFPTGMSGWPQLGSTGPVTIAGSVALAHAEHLAGLVLVQAVRPGTRYVSRGSTPVFDMRALVCSTGAPERVLGDALLAQLARYVGLPMGIAAVGTDSKVMDVQSGAERAMNCLTVAMAGATVIGGLGWLDNLNIMSHEMLVLDCEMAEAVRRFLRGADVDEDSLAVEAVNRVGPSWHYLEDEHTLRHFRQAVWYPELWQRSAGPAQPEDADSLRRRAQARIRELLGSHRPPKMTQAAREDIRTLLG